MPFHYNKRASVAKLLGGGGLGGILGYLFGKHKGWQAGDRAGYDRGSASGNKDTLMSLLKGMHHVVEQGASSTLDLSDLVNPKMTRSFIIPRSLTPPTKV